MAVAADGYWREMAESGLEAQLDDAGHSVSSETIFAAFDQALGAAFLERLAVLVPRPRRPRREYPVVQRQVDPRVRPPLANGDSPW